MIVATKHNGLMDLDGIRAETRKRLNTADMAEQEECALIFGLLDVIDDLRAGTFKEWTMSPVEGME